MAETTEGRFKRDVINSSRLEYVRRMKTFYELLFDDLSRQLGNETEYKVKVTEKMLETIEERLSEFEEKERKIVDNCRQLLGEVEGVTF